MRRRHIACDLFLAHDRQMKPFTCHGTNPLVLGRLVHVRRSLRVVSYPVRKLFIPKWSRPRRCLDYKPCQQGFGGGPSRLDHQLVAVPSRLWTTV